MNKSIIVTGVPGGKTRFAERIAKHFRLHAIHQQWNGTSIFPCDYLYVTDSKHVYASAPHVMTFAEVAKQINDAIPTTQEFSTAQMQWPDKDRPGIYMASVSSDQEFYRYWDGRNFHYGDDEKDTAFIVRGRRWPRKSNLCWRGLAEEPIIVSEAA